MKQYIISTSKDGIEYTLRGLVYLECQWSAYQKLLT